jgi:hypothetical protein
LTLLSTWETIVLSSDAGLLEKPGEKTMKKQRYYHNTTAENKNIILGYVSKDGNFVTAEDKDLGFAPPTYITIYAADADLINDVDACKLIAESAVKEIGTYYEDFRIFDAHLIVRLSKNAPSDEELEIYASIDVENPGDIKQILDAYCMKKKIDLRGVRADEYQNVINTLSERVSESKAKKSAKYIKFYITKIPNHSYPY